MLQSCTEEELREDQHTGRKEEKKKKIRLCPPGWRAAPLLRNRGGRHHLILLLFLARCVARLVSDAGILFPLFLSSALHSATLTQSRPGPPHLATSPHLFRPYVRITIDQFSSTGSQAWPTAMPFFG